VKTTNPKLRGRVSLESIVERVEKNIRYKAYCMSQTCPFTEEDLYEVGRHEAIKAHGSFKPNAGYQHYNWMVIVGYQSMCKHIKLQKLREPVHVLMKKPVLPDVNCKCNMELERSMFMEELELIPPSALEVVGIILAVPLELVKVMAEGRPKKIKGRLREFLKGEGWTDREVSQSFTDIRQFVLRVK
jgi:hypothetical protein